MKKAAELPRTIWIVLAAVVALSALSGCKLTARKTEDGVKVELTIDARKTVHVLMDRRKPNGNAWDIMRGAPDPYVVVNGRSYRGMRCEDAHGCSIRVHATGRMHIEVWDADVLDDDSAGSTTCRSGRRCHTRGATVRVSG